MGSVPAKSSQQTPLHIVSRVIAAIVGGYVAANLLSVCVSYLLPTSQASGVMTGMLLSFVIYTAVVIWVFAVKTTCQVWIGLLSLCVASTALIFVVLPAGLL